MSEIWAGETVWLVKGLLCGLEFRFPGPCKKLDMWYTPMIPVLEKWTQGSSGVYSPACLGALVCWSSEERLSPNRRWRVPKITDFNLWYQCAPRHTHMHTDASPPLPQEVTKVIMWLATFRLWLLWVWRWGLWFTGSTRYPEFHTFLYNWFVFIRALLCFPYFVCLVKGYWC